MQPNDARNWRKRMAWGRPPPTLSLWPELYPLALPLPLTALEQPDFQLLVPVRQRIEGAFSVSAAAVEARAAAETKAAAEAVAAAGAAPAQAAIAAAAAQPLA